MGNVSEKKALQIVEEDGLNLERLAPRHKQNSTIVEAAVREDPLAIRFHELNIDYQRNLIKLALPDAIDIDLCADHRKLEEIRQIVSKDEELLVYYLEHGGKMDNFDDDIYFNFGSWRRILSVDGNYLRYLSYNLTTKEDVVRFAIQKDGNAFQYAGAYFRDSETMIMHAFDNVHSGDGLPRVVQRIYDAASDRMQRKPSVALRAVKRIAEWSDQSGFEYTLHPCAQLCGNPDFLKDAVDINGLQLKHIDYSDLKRYAWRKYNEADEAGIAYTRYRHEIIEKAVKQDWRALEYVSRWLEDDLSVYKKIVALALKQNFRGAHKFVDPEIKDDYDVMKYKP